MVASEPRDLRHAILETAKHLFIEQGYHGLSMRQIAEAVGVSKAALYYYFRDKEELFLAILDSFLDEMEAILDRVRQEEPTCRGRIRSLVEQILSQPPERRAVIRLASQERVQLSGPLGQRFDQSYQQKFLGKIRAILQEGMASGELRVMDPGVATWALLGMMYPYFYPAHFSEAQPPEDIAGQLVTIYLEGMGASRPD